MISRKKAFKTLSLEFNGSLQIHMTVHSIITVKNVSRLKLDVMLCKNILCFI